MVTIVDRESESHLRWIRESVQVRKLAEGISMNRDEGGYKLSHVWDPLLRSPSTTSGRRRPPTSGRNRQRHSWPLPRGAGEGRRGDTAFPSWQQQSTPVATTTTTARKSSLPEEDCRGSVEIIEGKEKYFFYLSVWSNEHYSIYFTKPQKWIYFAIRVEKLIEK